VIRRRPNGIVYYQFDALTESGVKHGIFTRLGGLSAPPYASLNVGHTVGDENERVDANQRLIFATLGLKEADVVTAHQVHGNRVAPVGAGDGGRVIPATDGLITRSPGQALLMRFADCLPLLLYDRRTGAVGLAHAGWRGTMRNVAGETVRAMKDKLGCNPADLVAGLGPAIGVCCYQVGQDVVDAARETFSGSNVFLQMHADGSFHFDLAGANAWQLRQAGVCHVEFSSLCTACRTDEFFSHRAEQGRTGRFAVLLVCPDRPQGKETRSLEVEGHGS
jgi:YfiH family protein